MNIQKTSLQSYLTFLCQLVLGGIFIYASLDKINHPDSFAQIIESYEILPIPIINLFAIFLPWLELFCGILFISGIWLKINSAILSGLLIIFIMAMWLALSRGLEINCGCFETIGETDNVSLVRILEDIGLLILALWVYFFPKTVFSAELIFANLSLRSKFVK